LRPGFVLPTPGGETGGHVRACRKGLATPAALEAKDAPVISIQSAMLVALGFLAATLLGLLLASALWSRAVRLTTKRLKAALPVSEPEIKADLDRLRATYAIRVHKLETQLEQAKLERARQLIEINRRDASISALERGMVAIKAELDENHNARRVLEQTVADRLPKVEARLTEAKRLLSTRDQEIAELAQGARRQKAALEEASSINAQRSAEIERLSSALAARGGRRGRADGTVETESEVALRVEVEALRTKTREQATLIDRLQRRLGDSFPVAAATTGSTNGSGASGAETRSAESAESQIGRLRESLSEAEQTLQLARTGAPSETDRSGDREKEVRILKARIEDQAGEIARLRAALAAFEQPDDRTGLGNSRLALKVRAGSAEAQAERQAATIAKLRAELAAANERLAHQAAHFMEEMRRIGAGTAPASGQARRTGRDGQKPRVAERVDLVPNRRPEPAAAGVAQAAVVEEPASGGQGGGGDPQPPLAVAAEMPQTASIPASERRRVSLLDRITGIGKG
jgi:chromosome segregation ATPase